MSASFGQPVPGARLLFELDPNSTSQFTGSDDFAEGTAAIALSTQAISEWDNALRVAGSGGNDAYAVRLAVNALPFSGEKRSIYIEWEQHDFVAGGNNGAAGLVFLADDSASFSGFLLGCVADNASDNVAAEIDQGTRFNGTNGSNFSVAAGFGTFWALGRKPAGVPPSLSVFQGGFNQAAYATGEVHRSGSNRASALAFAAHTMSANWNNLACKKWGLCMYGPTSPGTLPTSWDILSLRIWER